jgi:hypothetical protein
MQSFKTGSKTDRTHTSSLGWVQTYPSKVELVKMHKMGF